MNFFKTKSGQVVIWAAVIVAIAAFLYLTAPKSTKKTETKANANNTLQPSANLPVVTEPTNTNKPKTNVPVKKPVVKPVGFTEKKAPHFVSATIANNATITQIPPVLTLTFDANVLKTEQSFVTVKKDDITSATLNTSTLNDKTMSVKLNTNVANGDYYVYYVACFADTGCKDGRFGYHAKLP